ncbi:hypothetical protein BCR43DRAFT_288099 [Syncephalastrum racemosum]|uniref:Uncharacterized protein n=1 Tax=Syncephalastrum racemosum TaxID=13706 RepID=A0A1X2HDF7_SYNRA|nr:hypothetical protein BCR43DRAFT_288099 [Syncephalastrum racemosum]
MASGRKPDEENQLLTSSAASKKSTDAVKSRKSNQDRESTSSGPPSIDTSRHAFSRLIRNHSNDGCSSRGSSDCDDNGKRSKTIAERKRRRIHQHHHASSSPRLLFPRLMRKHKSYGSTNSSLSGHTSSNEDNITSDEEDLSLDDHTTENNADLVLPALDPNAQEVIASAASQEDRWFTRRGHVNFSNVRTRYRKSRKKARSVYFSPLIHTLSLSLSAHMPLYSH